MNRSKRDAGLAAAATANTEVFIDMPEASPRIGRLRAARELEPTFDTTRKYLNGRPPDDVQRVFGVTTLEFG